MSQRGDTIIEVLLAITVFSLVAIGAITIMNQGTNAAQRALEITLVRQQVDGQAEAIRATQQAAASGNPSTWAVIADDTSTGHYDVGATSKCPAVGDIPSGSFMMDPRNASKPAFVFGDMNSATALPYAQVIEESGTLKSHGIWIERTKNTSASLPDMFNFTVNACWYGAGIKTPMTISTEVRLYDPIP